MISVDQLDDDPVTPEWLVEMVGGDLDQLSGPERRAVEEWLAGDPLRHEACVRLRQIDAQIRRAFLSPAPDFKSATLALSESAHDRHVGDADGFVDADVVLPEASAKSTAVRTTQRSGQRPAARRRWPIGLSRRTVLAGTALVLAAVASIPFWYGGWKKPTVSGEKLWRAAVDWLAPADSFRWNTNLAEAPTTRRPLDAIAATPISWTALPNEFDDQAVVYQMRLASGRRVLVIAMQIDAPTDLDDSLPRNPNYVTTDLSIAVVSRDNQVWIVAVEGGADHYRELFSGLLAPV
jgi:hypothetical protein